MATEITLKDLPDDALHRILNALDCASLARISCTCKELEERGSQPALWKQRCEERWRVQETGTWRRLASRGQYKALFARKHAVRSLALFSQLDQNAREQVLRLSDRERAPSTLSSLYLNWEDVIDALKEDALSEDQAAPKARWAREALMHIQTRRAGEELCSLVYRSGNAHESLLDEGCMLLAQCHYPLSDLSAVSRFFDALAAELRRRMLAAGATEGKAALKLLSELLFAQPDSAPVEDERDRWWQPEETEIRRWGAVEEAALVVPQGNGSLNLRGNRENYGDPGNSLLPAVLLTGRGIPLTMCVIHAAVGRRAGLNVTGVNMPIHFINKYVEDGKELFIDCFNGGRLLTREEVPSVMLGTDMYLRFRMGYDPRIFNSARPKDVWIRAISNMQNSYAGLLTAASQVPPRNLALCNVLMCGILRTFTRQPYFVQQELVTDYVMSTWADGASLLPWFLQGSLALAPRDMNDSLR